MRPELFGLVLAGGHSTRMGADKGLLHYRGLPHREYLYNVLGQHCTRVFLSLNAQQVNGVGVAAGIEHLVDNAAYADTGPIGAVLNAHERFPQVAWFIVTCDLPFFDEAAAQQLVAARDTNSHATAFLNHELQQPEPLVAIYEPRFAALLPPAFADGERSIRRLLKQANVKLIREYDARWIQSANDRDAFETAKNILAQKRS
jgi:molybdopterin-guanine dinucleotide biosynthesis protein A